MKREEVWRREGSAPRRTGGVRIHFECLFWMFVQLHLRGSFFSVLAFSIIGFEGPNGNHFWMFLFVKQNKQTVLFNTIVFAHHYNILVRFWGSGTSGELQKTRTTTLGKSYFLDWKGGFPNFFFLWFQAHFWDKCWSSQAIPKNCTINFCVFLGACRSPWTIMGSLFICLYVYMFICLYVYMVICLLYVYLFICLYVNIPMSIIYLCICS